MLNMIRADVYKMYKSMVLKVLFMITTLSAITMMTMSHLVAQGKLDLGTTGIGFLFADVNVMSILGAVLAGIFICGDFDNKTIHEAIASGSSRSSVTVGKTMSFLCGVVIILLPYAVVTCIAILSGSRYDMGENEIGFLYMLTRDYGITLSGSMYFKLLFVVVSQIIVYLGQLSLCVPIAFVLKKPVLVVALFYGFSILSPQLMVLSKDSKVLDMILSCTPFGRDYSFLTIDTAMGDIVKAGVASLVFIIIMIGATYIVFRKTEIK